MSVAAPRPRTKPRRPKSVAALTSTINFRVEKLHGRNNQLQNRNNQFQGRINQLLPRGFKQIHLMVETINFMVDPINFMIDPINLPISFQYRINIFSKISGVAEGQMVTSQPYWRTPSLGSGGLILHAYTNLQRSVRNHVDLED